MYFLRYCQHQPDGGGIYGDAVAGSSFVHPDSPLRDALTAAAARQVTRMTGNGNEWMPIGKMIDEKVVVNGIVALLATGGSTNHTMHRWRWRTLPVFRLTGMTSLTFLMLYR